MKNLKDAWSEICDYSVALKVPPSRWKHEWATHEKSARRLYNAVRLYRPKYIVETGTIEGLSAYAMAKAAHENNNSAKIFTVDFDRDPEVSLTDEEWADLRKFREENLQLARDRFPNVEINFLNGDSRKMLPTLFPIQITHWDFFFQDSMHHRQRLSDEWAIMRPHARPGSVVAFDDVHLNWKLLPRHLMGKKDFCLSFALTDARRDDWQCESTTEGRSQFWARKA